jgi:hypothetical protein
MAGTLNLTLTKGSTFERMFAIKGQRVTQNGSISTGSTTIANLLRTDILEVGMTISATGIDPAATIATIVDDNTVTMSLPATATNASATILFTKNGYVDISAVDFRGQIRKTHSDSVIQASFAFTKNANNTVKMTLTSTQTASLSGNDFVYDVEMFTAGDAFVDKVLAGTVTAIDEVTR